MPITNNKSKSGDKQQKREEWEVIEDDRFTGIHNDPRFRRPSRRATKVKIDQRFAHMLDNDDFDFVQSVDKYGRPIHRSRDQVNLRKFYDVEDEEEQHDDDKNEDESENEENVALGDVDYARGEGLLSSSEEESEKEQDLAKSDHSDQSSDESVVELASSRAKPIQAGVDPSEILQTVNVPRGDESHRLAVVNMDWDHIAAVDLYKVFEAFKPKQGIIHSVTVYPSEFGKERMKVEDSAGPCALFDDNNQKKNADADEDDDEDPFNEEEEEEGEEDDLFPSSNANNNNEEFDQEKLRKYQLERLRYYYAVVECDSIATAKSIYDQCDGTEYEHSSILIDLRYIPDDVSFADEQPKERVTESTAGVNGGAVGGAAGAFKPKEFVTNALQNSNVKLTWDEDDPMRLKVTKHKFSKDELKSMDFDAYLASSGGSEDEEEDVEVKREKYRALLLGGDGDGSSGDEGRGEEDQEMEITFAPGLSSLANKLLEKKEQREKRADETVFEAETRKRLEKKKQRKMEKMAESGVPFSDDDINVDVEGDDFFKDAFGSDFEQPDEKPQKSADSNKKLNKKSKKSRDAEEVDPELQAIMQDIVAADGHRQHFDMDEIEKESKQQKKKLMKKKNKNKTVVEEPSAGDGFQLDLTDDRFSALFSSEQYAVDPTSSKFKKTKAMETIVKERQKRQHGSMDKTAHTANNGGSSGNIKSIVEKLKAKPQPSFKRAKQY